jgi:Flp pilus assembly protein TadG
MMTGSGKDAGMRDGWLGRMWQACVRARKASSRGRRARGRRAAVMLEFAIVGPPFLLALVFIVEVGYDLYAQEMLDYGMQTAARQIQLGNAQGNTHATFMSDYFCPAVAGFLACSDITVNVAPVTTTADTTATYYSPATTATLPTTSGHLNTANFTYCPGLPNELMLATAVYTSPSIVALFVPSLASNLGAGLVRVTISASAFVNENFTQSAETPSGCAS